mmetsp:Transcript_30628/g.46702  ORF Transcript_30628/g.46702 Transcript_30628/m.46702 type:complete len:213 (+) Transcript_30628:111-749(+)
MGCTQSSSAGVIEEGPTTTNPVKDILNEKKGAYPLYGPNRIMARKQHGTSSTPVQSNLLYGCDFKTADRICNYNRHFAEHAGYFRSGKRQTEFLKAVEEAKKRKEKITFYDSNTGYPLFTAPVNRSWDAWLLESKNHGWPSFRDDEVNWEYFRCLRNGESVSIHGTHLGHNLPDGKGNRYCINLVSIAGSPVKIEQPIDSSKHASNDDEIDL